MRHLILAATALLMTMTAHAGDNGGGTLTCASASGRTKVSGMAGAAYNGEGPADLTYAIDGKPLHFDTAQDYSKGAGPVVLADFTTFTPKKDYSVVIKRVASSVDQGKTYVYSTPVFTLTSKGILKETSKDVFTFTAIISSYSLDPRQYSDLSNPELQTFNQDIQVNCTLDVTL